ncbi:Uncharacterised protein [Chromobacterium violaceum]|uniref:3-dehydroquinate synthase n=1 Tax=Chromobacterium violaceum TaxID=536 RepID=A0A3S4HFJ5_CHRVL|nr:Uncharacterised protein [Chromobacterium violaceum]
MITLDLILPDTRYPIHIGHGLLEQVDLLLPHLPLPKAAIVSNATVARCTCSGCNRRWKRAAWPAPA